MNFGAHSCGVPCHICLRFCWEESTHREFSQRAEVQHGCSPSPSGGGWHLKEYSKSYNAGGLFLGKLIADGWLCRMNKLQSRQLSFFQPFSFFFSPPGPSSRRSRRARRRTFPAVVAKREGGSPSSSARCNIFSFSKFQLFSFF
jgi:hypothetical protein